MFYRKHARVRKDCGDQLMTKQSHKDECDIHKILKQFQRTGIITHVQNAKGAFEDLPDSVDFQEALSILDQANSSFAALPSAVRDHFQNDPARFLAAFNDSSQADYLRSVGLLNAKPPEAARPAESDPT